MSRHRLTPFAISTPLAALLICVSCSTVRQVRPLAAHQSSVTASLGGPFTGQVKWMPIPMLGLGYNRGILDSMLDIEAGFYLTSALYGVLHIDAGGNWRPWLAKRFRPGLIVSPKVFLMTNFKPQSVRAYPDLGLTACWKVRDLLYVYTGAENWFEFYDERSDGTPQEKHWFPVPYVGVDLGRHKWQVQLEGRLYTPGYENTRRATQNVGAGEYGLWGIMLGVKRTFGPKGNEK